jgi:UPF0042 nucleotide-binding protein
MSKASPRKNAATAIPLPPRRPVLLVTGLSGAGHSSALKTLEDMGYKAVDNLPLSLLEPLLTAGAGGDMPVAVGIDSRTWDFSSAELVEAVEKLKALPDLAVKLIFMDCQDDVLQQRFTETRRVHPLAVDRPVRDGIAMERQIMAPVRDSVDYVIDTSGLRPQDLKRILRGYFRLETESGISVFITSFGFRNGLPREADMVFDVRFLDNPHWDPLLRPLSGLDRPVADKVGKNKTFKTFFTNMTGMIAPILPHFESEGRHYLTIAIGCTGGRHRSVYTAERLGAWFKRAGYRAEVRHRDLAGWTARQGVEAQGAPAKVKTKKTTTPQTKPKVKEKRKRA